MKICELCKYLNICPYKRLYEQVKAYGFPDGTKAGDDIADILEEIEAED